MDNSKPIIGHVTEAGGNIFLDLGFEKEEAEKLYADSERRITEAVLLKEQLMSELARWIEENKLKQLDAANILHVSRPRISDIVNKKTSKFTIDCLVNMLGIIGKPVRLAIG